MFCSDESPNIARQAWIEGARMGLSFATGGSRKGLSMGVCRKEIELASASDSTVLILGETGTGKTTVAREIHRKSSRFRAPFVAINLATLHEGTFEAELFGNKKGALQVLITRGWALESARGGTVFLDEVGELPLKAQARLLEFLHSQTIFRMGSSRSTTLDVRVIAATNRSLKSEVRGGRFRQDLYHRLCVHLIELPPIRKSAEKIQEIVDGCLRRLCVELDRELPSVSDDVWDLLRRHPWPGNYRQMINALEYSLIRSNNQIDTASLPSWFYDDLVEIPEAMFGKDSQFGLAEVPLGENYHETLSRFEKIYLSRAYEACRGRVNLTSRSIRLCKSTLLRKLRAYGLHSSVRAEAARVANGSQ